MVRYPRKGLQSRSRASVAHKNPDIQDSCLGFRAIRFCLRQVVLSSLDEDVGTCRCHLTDSVYEAVLQKSIPTQIQQLFLDISNSEG